MKKRILIAIGLAIAGCLLVIGLAWAFADGYLLSAWVTAGGGSTVSSGGYSLSDTAGQPVVRPVLSAGPYRLEGGFWHSAGTADYIVYLPTVRR